MKAIEVLSIVAMSLFGLVGVFLFSKKRAWRIGLGWLAVFFLLLALNYLDGILLLNGTLLTRPEWAFWEDPMVLLYGPLLYFFVLSLKEGQATISGNRWLHIIPFFIAEGVVWSYHRQSTSAETRALLSRILSVEPNIYVFLAMMPFFAHALGYTLLARHTLVKHRQRLMNFFSTVELDWAFALLSMVMVIFLASLISAIFQLASPPAIYTAALLAVIILSILMTLRILLVALHQPLFHAVSWHEPTGAIPQQEQAQVQRQIDQALGQEKLFRNPELTLKDLATHVSLSERTVSHVINLAMAENFYDLINRYRIEEAQQLLQSNNDPKLTILEVLYQVGFNSKSSFNTQFKKYTGLTPTEFRRRSRTEGKK